MPLPVHNDVPYLPDGACDQPQSLDPYPLWLTLAIFLGVFVVLQWAWGEARDTWVERLVIHEATVKPAAAMVQIITPEAHAHPVAASIKAPAADSTSSTAAKAPKSCSCSSPPSPPCAWAGGGS